MPTIMRNGVLTQISVSDYNQYMATLREPFKINADGSPVADTNADLGNIWVNCEKFTGYSTGGLLTVNTKTYVEEPTRANDGSIANINDYDTFIVPRCKVNFKYFNIEDYKRLCNAIMSNEFVVKYYDKQFGTMVEHKMYCEPEEMYKIYNVETSVIGVLDYEISFIGTLNDLDTYKVVYNANGGSIYDYQGLYSSATTYSLGQRVSFQGEYYEAIYKNTTVPINTTPPNATYWLAKSPTLWSETAYYNQGDVVYQTKVENGETNYYYYEAIYEGQFTGRYLTNAMYWKSITISNYNSSETYNKGEYVYIVAGTPLTTIYKAIYENTEFSGISPENSAYWKKLAMFDGIEVAWGNSIVVSEIEDLFDVPTGYASANEWNTKADGTGYKYFPNQSMNIFTNITLYAQWVVEE